MLFISFPINLPIAVKNFNKGIGDPPKPKVMVALGDTWQLPPETSAGDKGRPGGIKLVGSHAAGHYALYALWTLACPQPRRREGGAISRSCRKFGKGAQPEWLGKQILAAAGIRVPDGELARTVDEAVAAAERVGYPVVLKAQARALTHKTEAGGVTPQPRGRRRRCARPGPADASEHQARCTGGDARRLPDRKDVAQRA